MADQDHSSTHGDEVVFEVFEASPVSEKVLATKGALQWDFPGGSVAIPASDFDDLGFQEQLATFLEKASTESIKQFSAHIYKAGSVTYESRDTVDPAVSAEISLRPLPCSDRTAMWFSRRDDVL